MDQTREKMMKSATERKLRKRWSFFDRVFRTGSSGKQQKAEQNAPLRVR